MVDLPLLSTSPEGVPFEAKMMKEALQLCDLFYSPALSSWLRGLKADWVPQHFANECECSPGAFLEVLEQFAATGDILTAQTFQERLRSLT